jgi:hypothetical protein
LCTTCGLKHALVRILSPRVEGEIARGIWRTTANARRGEPAASARLLLPDAQPQGGEPWEHRGLSLREPPPHRGPSVIDSSSPEAASPITKPVVHSNGSLERGSHPGPNKPTTDEQDGEDGGPQPVPPSKEPDGCGSRSPTRRLFPFLTTTRDSRLRTPSLWLGTVTDISH